MNDVAREVAEILFGDGGDRLVSKMNPTQSDVATSDRKKRAMTAGLSAVGGAAGAAGLGYAAHNLGRTYRAARKGTPLKVAPAVKGVGRMASVGRAIKHEKAGAVLLPLEVAGLGGEVMATHILHGDTKKKQTVPGTMAKGLGRDLQDIQQQAGPVPTKGSLTRAVLTNPKVQAKGIETTKKAGGTLKKLPNQVATAQSKFGKSAPRGVAPRDEVVWEGEFAKVDNEKQQVFGWASVIELNGRPVVDLQGDYISPDEMEKAAYSYVVKSRKGGDMHLRDNAEPIQKSDMIESFIVTDEKRKAMGLPDSVPTGWWVGFQVHDPEHWADIKEGRRTGFSIHGHGRRA